MVVPSAQKVELFLIFVQINSRNFKSFSMHQQIKLEKIDVKKLQHAIYLLGPS
jgi:hypothetical protein